MYRHYVTIDEGNRVTDGWSTGERPGIGPGAGGILLTAEGGYAFALLGVQHPALFTEDRDRIPRYACENGGVRLRTEEEIDGDRPGPTPEPEPTEMEKLRADVDYIMVMEGLA